MSDIIQVTGRKIEYVEIEVDILEVIEQILKYKNWNNKNNSYVISDDSKIIRKTNISNHGSPLYKSDILSTNTEDVKLFNNLVEIKKYFMSKKY